MSTVIIAYAETNAAEYISDIGRVTSGTQSPTLKKSIGLGYVDNAYAKEGTEIFISIRNQSIKAKVVKPPFVK